VGYLMRPVGGLLLGVWACVGLGAGAGQSI